MKKEEWSTKSSQLSYDAAAWAYLLTKNSYWEAIQIQNPKKKKVPGSLGQEIDDPK